VQLLLLITVIYYFYHQLSGGVLCTLGATTLVICSSSSLFYIKINMENLDEVLQIYKQIKEAKDVVKELEKKLDVYKKDIQKTMSGRGVKLLENKLGCVQLVERKGSVSWDVPALEERLGLEVEKYRVQGKATSYLKFGLY